MDVTGWLFGTCVFDSLLFRGEVNCLLCCCSSVYLHGWQDGYFFFSSLSANSIMAMHRESISPLRLQIVTLYCFSVSYTLHVKWQGRVGKCASSFETRFCFWMVCYVLEIEFVPSAEVRNLPYSARSVLQVFKREVTSLRKLVIICWESWRCILLRGVKITCKIEKFARKKQRISKKSYTRYSEYFFVILSVAKNP